MSRRKSPATRLIIVGEPEAASVARQRFQIEPFQYQLAGLVSPGNGAYKGQVYDGMRVLGDIEALPQIVQTQANGNGGVLVAVAPDRYPEVESIVRSQLLPGCHVRIALYPIVNGAQSEGVNGAGPQPKRFSRPYKVMKRSLDLAVTLFALFLGAPLIAAIAILIKLDSPGPVLFGQTRVGLGGRLFQMYKFRSMRVDAETMLEDLADQNEASGAMFKMADDPRVTRVGKIIRRLSLDELPQLFNVIQGTMSLVGPRPPMSHELLDYEPRHFRRFEASPGITGLWQVTRGKQIHFEEMVRLDMEHIDNWSLRRDVAVLLKTIPVMLKGTGAY